MKSLLVLLVLTSLAASAQAWPSWSDIKNQVTGVTDDIKDGWDQHIDPLFDDAKESWDDKVKPFLDDVAKRAKKFVIGHRDNFEGYAASLKEKAALLDECRDCADSGTCSPVQDENCEELYGVFSKVFKFYDCFNEADTPKCIQNRNYRNAERKSEEKVGDKSEEKVDDKSEEKVDDKSEEKVDDKSEEKVDDKSEEKVDDKSEEKVDDKSEEKVDDKLEEEVADKLEGKDFDKSVEDNAGAAETKTSEEAQPAEQVEEVVQEIQPVESVNERKVRNLLRELLKSNNNGIIHG